MPDNPVAPVTGGATSALDRGTRAKALLWLLERDGTVAAPVDLGVAMRGSHSVIAQMLGLLPSPPPTAVSRGRRIAGGDR